MENCDGACVDNFNLFEEQEDDLLWPQTEILAFDEKLKLNEPDVAQDGIIKFEKDLCMRMDLDSDELGEDHSLSKNEKDQIQELPVEIVSTKEETTRTEESIHDECSDEDSISDLESYILKTLSKLRDKQDQVDDGTYTRNGPGRKRKYAPRTSAQLRDLAKDYLRENIACIVANKRCKKLTYHLIEMCAAKNMYKRNEVSHCLFRES